MAEYRQKLINSIINNIDKNDREKFDISFGRIFYIFLKKYKFISRFFLVIFLGINLHTLIVRITRPIFKGNFTLLISDPLNRDEKNFSGETSLSLEETALGRTKNDIPTLVAFLDSSYILSPIAKELNMSLKDLRKNIVIATPDIEDNSNSTGFAGLINVDYYSKKPKIDIDKLKYISERFIISANNLRTDKLKGALKFLSDQEPILRVKLDDIQNKIASFREKNLLLKPLSEAISTKTEERKIINLISSLDNDLKRLKDIKLQILNDNLITSGFEETISKRDQFDRDSGREKGLSIASSASLLLKEFNKVEAELSKAKSFYNEESKIIKSLEERVNKIKPQLKDKQIQAVESTIMFNLAKRNALEKQLKSLNSEFRKMPKLISEYNILIKQLEIAEQNLSAIFDAQEKIKLEIAQNSLSWIIIEPPKFEDRPVYPSIFKRFISSIFLGLFICLIVSLLIDKKDNSFTRVREITKNFEEFIILGIIPYINKLNNQFSFKQILQNYNENNQNLDELNIIKNNLELESLRNIYISLKSISDKKTNVFNVTSSIPNEGKTTISILISFILSQMGERVLLVDADLRNPKIHELLEIKNNFDLTRLLREDIRLWNKSISKIEESKNLSIITTTKKATNPSDLLSNSLKSLIDDIKNSQKFDYVIINSPPVLRLSDSLFTSKNCDRELLIISIDKVSKKFAYESTKILLDCKDDDQSIPAIIINEIKENSASDEFKYSGYYYSYFDNKKGISLKQQISKIYQKCIKKINKIFS